MQELLTLIDKAAEKCGGKTALAKRMGIDPSDITHLRSGGRPMSPELAAEIADIAGEDAREAAIQAIILRSKGTRKGAKMLDVLGKGVAAGVAAMCLFSYNVDSNSAMETIASEVNPLYIVSNTN